MNIKKKIYISLLSFLFIFILYDIYNPYFNVSSYIEKRWDISLPFKVKFKNIIEIKRRDYVKIKVSKEEKEAFLETQMEDFGYTSWSLQGIGFKMEGLDIEGSDYFTSELKKSPKLTYKKIYISKDDYDIIFLDYCWAGY